MLLSRLFSQIEFQAVSNQIPKNLVFRNSVRGMSEFSNEDDFLKSSNMDTERKGKEKCKSNYGCKSIFIVNTN